MVNAAFVQRVTTPQTKPIENENDSWAGGMAVIPIHTFYSVRFGEACQESGLSQASFLVMYVKPIRRAPFGGSVSAFTILKCLGQYETSASYGTELTHTFFLPFAVFRRPRIIPNILRIVGRSRSSCAVTPRAVNGGRTQNETRPTVGSICPAEPCVVKYFGARRYDEADSVNHRDSLGGDETQA